MYIWICIYSECSLISLFLALTFAARRNYAYAGKILEESIEINRKAFGKKSPEVAIGYVSLYVYVYKIHI